MKVKFNFEDTSQQIFESLAGQEEEKRQVSEETAARVAKDNAQVLMNKRREEFSAALSKARGDYSGVGSGFKRVESYSDIVEEVKKEEKRDAEKKDYYSSGSSSPTKSRFGGTSTSSSTQSSEEKKAKAVDSYVMGLKDELDSVGKAIKGTIKANAALAELERKVSNDAPWTIKELQHSHEKFVSTGGGRYVTKETRRSLTKTEARDLQRLRKEFGRDRDILGFLFGGMKLWKD